MVTCVFIPFFKYSSFLLHAQFSLIYGIRLQLRNEVESKFWLN
jgi:hypothetical protein